MSKVVSWIVVSAILAMVSAELHKGFLEPNSVSDFNVAAYLEGFNLGVQPDIGDFANQNLGVCVEKMQIFTQSVLKLYHDIEKADYLDIVADLTKTYGDITHVKDVCSDLLRFYLEASFPIIASIKENPSKSFSQIVKNLEDKGDQKKMKEFFADWLVNLKSENDTQAGLDNGQVVDLIFQGFEDDYY